VRAHRDDPERTVDLNLRAGGLEAQHGDEDEGAAKKARDWPLNGTARMSNAECQRPAFFSQ